MGFFDILLLLILAGFVFFGLFFGLIRTVGSLAGVLAGFLVAGYLYLDFFEWGKALAFGYNQAGQVVSFLLIFTVVNRSVCFLFALLNHVLDIISIIPFVKTINRVSGAMFGLMEGSLLIGLTLHYAQQLEVMDKLLAKLSADSKIVPFVKEFSDFFLPILPSLVDKFKSIL
jgi:membrane protein required for colicin V production